MRPVEEDLERAKRRTIWKQNKVGSLVLGLQDEIAGIENRLNGSGYENIAVREVNRIVREGSEAALNKRFLMVLQNSHKEYFGYLSKLGRTIDKAMDASVNKKEMNFSLDKRSVNELLEWSLHHETPSKIPPTSSTKEEELLIEIKGQLERGEYKSALQKALCPTFLENYEELSFLIYKLTVSTVFQEEEMTQALHFMMSNFPKAFSQRSQELGEIIHAWSYGKDSLPKRLKSSQSASLLSACLKQIALTIRKIRGTQPQPVLREILMAGAITLPTLTKLPDGIVGAELPPEMTHHSTIHCPIVKDTCLLDNKPILQDCGHIVGEQSVKKMLETNRLGRDSGLFKCPTCPNQQKPSTMRHVIY